MGRGATKLGGGGERGSKSSFTPTKGGGAGISFSHCEGGTQKVLG